MHRLRRTSRYTAVPLTAFLLFSACTNDVVSPRAVSPRAVSPRAVSPRAVIPVPTAHVRTDVSPVGRSGTGLTFSTDSGTFTLDQVNGAIIGPDGTISTLAPDAMAIFVKAWQDIAQSDSIAQMITETAARQAPPPCNPRFRVCGPAEPLSFPGIPRPESVRRIPDIGTAETTSGDESYRLDLVDFNDPNAPLDCRGIATAIYDAMPAYRATRARYLLALGSLGTAALYGVGRIPLKPQAGAFFAPPTDAKGLLALYTAKYATPFLAELALADWQFAKTNLAVLGTFFAIHSCLTDDWGPPKTLPPRPENTTGSGGSGGDSTPGASGGSMTCYFRVQTVDGVEVSRNLWYCDVN